MPSDSGRIVHPSYCRPVHINTCVRYDHVTIRTDLQSNLLSYWGQVKLKVEVQLSPGTAAVEMVSILEFRRHAEAIIAKVRQGKRLILTYRGKPVIRLEPIIESQIGSDDPFYTLDSLAVPGGHSVTNEEIDQTIYGQ